MVVKQLPVIEDLQAHFRTALAWFWFYLLSMSVNARKGDLCEDEGLTGQSCVSKSMCFHSRCASADPDSLWHFVCCLDDCPVPAIADVSVFECNWKCQLCDSDIMLDVSEHPTSHILPRRYVLVTRFRVWNFRVLGLTVSWYAYDTWKLVGHYWSMSR